MIEDSYLIILGIIVVILFIALIVLTYKVFDLQHKVADGTKTIIREETQTQKKQEERKEQQAEEIIPEPKNPAIHDVNLTEGVSDINDSMKRYTIKYDLDSATLASKDGFSIASSHADSEQEAANLTARYQVNAITEIGDTHIIPLEYRGEEILILCRTTQKIPGERADMMIRDGKSILSHWL
ncbi:hypothetical protein L1S32_01425 [Methanogenium sp. S4BF]|uniref:hypothetical protein n=1 Tax=Methanogenium sp. S4BF TaxID=1789226 RepID=UPI00241808D7|nr:hypothetical protein [Methanogenium sp. S4BF]WFN34810.1 hypothetical protein L1S32_01425 [Methanogenium sp. S4BF]